MELLKYTSNDALGAKVNEIVTMLKAGSPVIAEDPRYMAFEKAVTTELDALRGAVIDQAARITALEELASKPA